MSIENPYSRYIVCVVVSGILIRASYFAFKTNERTIFNLPSWVLYLITAVGLIGSALLTI